MTDTIIESMPFWLVWFIFGGLSLLMTRAQGWFQALVVVACGMVSYTATYFGYAETVGRPPVWASCGMVVIAMFLMGVLMAV